MPKNKVPNESGAKVLQLPFQRRKQLENDIAHISEEMYKRNRELAETNKVLSLLRTIDALVLESHTSLKLVCEHIAEAVTQATDYAFVGLFTRSSNSHNEMALYGWSGSSWLGTDQPLGFNRPLHIDLNHDWFTSQDDNRLISIEHISNADLARFLKCSVDEIERLRKRLPLKSLYILKLQARRQLVGLMVVGFLSPLTELSESDTVLMDRLSDSVGVALDNKLLFEENQHVLKQLKESNAKLKALDEAKDDFISMASHQLRTPLTSVKGYISMVMEGDAGDVNEMQRNMLGQAFFSSQRMVYLIADLLNVSRLRTGKFIVERAPVNLATVVQEEIGQLVETAKARSLSLEYEKPDQFPQLMLDETKTRQIIMNFVDNAIYYTPAGGHIKVRLLDRPSTVELRVEDDGIGVPKAEQHHLFTKFYRAGNARQARPDGTGLGLFMAKKVILAQGGAVIFDSAENKGSTFGFIFSKTKLGVPAGDQLSVPETSLATKESAEVKA